MNKLGTKGASSALAMAMARGTSGNNLRAEERLLAARPPLHIRCREMGGWCGWLPVVAKVVRLAWGEPCRKVGLKLPQPIAVQCGVVRRRVSLGSLGICGCRRVMASYGEWCVPTTGRKTRRSTATWLRYMPSVATNAESIRLSFTPCWKIRRCALRRMSAPGHPPQQDVKHGGNAGAQSSPRACRLEVPPCTTPITRLRIQERAKRRNTSTSTRQERH